MPVLMAKQVLSKGHAIARVRVQCMLQDAYLYLTVPAPATTTSLDLSINKEFKLRALAVKRAEA